MDNIQGQSKVYLNTLEKIKEIIHHKNLKSGDKLPSERELADYLHVGRSSVREALRAMELLGLIETKRGEGTYVADFRDHQLVELLGGFVLQREHAKSDVTDTKQLLEMACIVRLIVQKKKMDIPKWQSKHHIQEEEFFEELLGKTENFLLVKIWTILFKFEQTIIQTKKIIYKESYIKLLHAINRKETQEALHIYYNFFDKRQNK